MRDELSQVIFPFPYGGNIYTQHMLYAYVEKLLIAILEN